MRKSYVNFAAVLALTATVFSCQKAEMEAPQAEQTFDKVDAVLTAVLEPRTKVALDFPALSWEDQDEIAVFDGLDPAPNKFTYTAPAEEGGETDQPAAVSTKAVARPSFVGQLTESAGSALYAVYPYDEDATLTDGKITTTIPHAQVVPEGGNVDNSALLCVASSATDELAFKNVLGLVRVVIPTDMGGKFNKIAIKGANNETVAGTGAVSVSDTPSFEATAAQTEITLTYANGGAFPAGDYYVAVAPVKFESGFSISFTKGDGRTGTKSTTKANEIIRNGGLDVNDQLSAMTWSYIISTKDELVAWNNNYKSWTKNDVVELGADINLDGVNWVPHDFSGVFDGKNHKIYNISMSRNGYCGFVAVLLGTIQNLYLGTSDGTTYDNKSVFTYTPVTTTVSTDSWVHMGSVSGSINNGAVIKNVTNFVKIHVPDSDGLAKVCMGGLVSMGAGTGEIQDCVNYGEIVCDASKGFVTTMSNHQIGGIMCKTDSKVTITNCKNYGNISAAGAYVDNVGGIMANPNGNATDKGENKTYIKDCYNYGNITITKTKSAVTPMALGGIVGKLTGATIENCHNEGDISSVCDVLTGIGGVAGIHKLEFESKVINCSNGVQNASDKGILTFNPADGTQQMVIGGVLGYSEDYKGKLTVQNCTNYAPISVSYNNMRNIGGIVGAIGKVTNKDGEKSSIELLINECHNYGAMTIGGTASYSGWQRQIGGIVGMLYGSDNGVTINKCSNNATIHTTASGGGENRVAGILGHTNYGKIVVSSCDNNAEVKATDSATNPRPAGIISVAMAATSTEVSDCNNNGTITCASSVGNVRCGGIAGYSQGLVLSRCNNNGLITSTNAGAELQMGGIVGHDNKATVLNSCKNSVDAQVFCTKFGTTSYVGGLIGVLSTTGSVKSSHNEGLVKISQVAQHCNVGGIAGASSGSVTECINTQTGKVVNEQKTTNSKYALAGGIVGRGYDKSSITKCLNNGHVEATVFTTNRLTGAGGILGQAQNGVTLKDNENHGEVKGLNQNASARIYVGGIVATDGEATTHTGATTITGNINYGTVSLTAPTPAASNDIVTDLPAAAAGGIFGFVINSTMPTAATDYNINYGEVIANKAADDMLGNAGALAGASNLDSWSGKVGKNVVVNGVAWSESIAATWLCPVAANALTATYVDAIE